VKPQNNSYKTNHLLDLCRIGKATKNDVADTAATELCSYIVFASLMLFDTTLPEVLLSRVDVLNNVVANPHEYPKDMVDEEAVEPDTEPTAA
jgi:hypothetical protein